MRQRQQSSMRLFSRDSCSSPKVDAPEAPHQQCMLSLRYPNYLEALKKERLHKKLTKQLHKRKVLSDVVN